jgi:choline dehydrogenase-like flavoprotein
MYYVVGSGPAGVACAHALSAAGRSVTILDGGLALEPEREAIRASAALKPRAEWTEQERTVLRTVVPAGREVPQKLVHGSDYPYRRPAGAPEIRYGKLKIRASYAKGGLSNVWGATLLPFRDTDIHGWPVAPADLAKSYAEVLTLMPVSGQEDDLSPLFTLPAPSMRPLRQSRQIQTLLRRAARNKTKLNAGGVFVGGSRLAVNADDEGDAPSCYYCGYCLHGCPRDVVYSSRHSLAGLIQTGRVRYQPGVVVRSVTETESGVRIEALRSDGSPVSLEGERLFLGAGAISSTAILMRSLGLYDCEARFSDSQYYLFPMLQARAVPRVADEALHTLSQSFIEVFDESISPFALHLQVYSYNDHLGQILDHKLGALTRLFPKNLLLGRMLLVQGYLHSDHSGEIVGRLRREGDHDVFDLSESLNPETRPKIAKVLKKLTGHALNLGAAPLAPLLEVTEPGRGFHVGGSFPMAADPGPRQTDRLGRPHGAERIHVVDATVFPTIPATTITLTVMANAHRIGMEASRIDSPEKKPSKSGGYR